MSMAPDPADTRPAVPGGSAHPLRGNAFLLAAVAVGFGAVQLATMGLGYAYGHDEAVYLSQLDPVMPAYLWGSHRAWGMPALVTPLSLLDAPLAAGRLYLIALSSTALFLAYRVWLAVRDSPAVPIAAALFASTYVVIYHGSLALPNYYTALGAVAATGYFLRCRRDKDARWAPAGLAAAVAFSALMRPSDSVWLAAALALAWLGLPRWRRPAVGVALAAGQVAGWAPWLIEASVRFGGPLARLRAARDAVGGGSLHLDGTTVELYLRMWSSQVLECYTGGGNPCEIQEPVSPVTIGWWVTAAVLVVIGVGVAIRKQRAAEGVVPLAVGLSLAFSYFFLLRYGAVRFLLPAGALLALPAATGLSALPAVAGRSALPAATSQSVFGRVPRLSLRIAGVVLAVAVVVGHAGVQAVETREYTQATLRARSGYLTVVERARELGTTPPCLVMGDSAHAVAYHLGCASGGRLRDHPEREPAAVTSARAQGTPVAVTLRSPAPAGSFLERWRAERVEGPGQRLWTVYQPIGPPAPPAG